MHEMRTFLVISARHLWRPLRSKLSIEPEGQVHPYLRRSSSTFATFDSLRCDAIYFYGELPLETRLSEEWVDDAAWGSCGPVRYDEIAHVLIPRFFIQETTAQASSASPEAQRSAWNQWEHEQDIDGLSRLLDEAAIPHSLAADVLEVKRF